MGAVAEEDEEGEVVAQDPFEEAGDGEEDAAEEDAAGDCSCCETARSSPAH